MVDASYDAALSLPRAAATCRRVHDFMYIVLGMTMIAISHQFNGHPNSHTVGRIIKEYYANGRVLELTGNRGTRHMDRKFDMLAWETLVHLVQEEEQDSLQGECC